MINLHDFPRGRRGELELVLVKAKLNVLQGSSPLAEFDRLVGRRDGMLKSDHESDRESGGHLRRMLEGMTILDLNVSPRERDRLLARLAFLEGRHGVIRYTLSALGARLRHTADPSAVGGRA